MKNGGKNVAEFECEKDKVMCKVYWITNGIQQITEDYWNIGIEVNTKDYHNLNNQTIDIYHR